MAHIVISAVLAASSILVPQLRYLLSPLVGVQVILLCTCAAIGLSSWQWRVATIAVASVYSAVIGSLISYIHASSVAGMTLRFWEFLFPTGLLFTAVARSIGLFGTMFALRFLERFWNMRLHHDPSVPPTSSNERFQFSILQLMVLTTAVGGVIVIGKIVRQAISPDLFDSRPDGFLMLLVVISAMVTGILIMTVQVFFSLWAALTRDSSKSRIAIALLVSAAIGLVWPFYFSHPWTAYLIAPVRSAGSMLVIILSLLVFRRSGYRWTQDLPSEDEIDSNETDLRSVSAMDAATERSG